MQWINLCFDLRPLQAAFLFPRELPANHPVAARFARTRKDIPLIMLIPKSFRMHTYKNPRKC